MCPDCDPIPCIQTPCLDCQPVEGVSPCLNGEPCDEILDAQCWGYSGEPLANIGVATGDRGDAILRKLNTNHTSAGILVQDSDTVHLLGTGINSDKLEADLRIDPNPLNIITSSTDGVKVELTKAIVLALFDFIEGDVDLQARWCELVSNCAANACGIPTGISATMV